jgi:hypothetical protein
MRSLDDYDPAPDHVRGAKYANLLLDTSLEQGDVVQLIYLAGVEPAFFERIEAGRDLDADHDPLYGEFKRDPDVISVPDIEALPDEFEPREAPPGVTSQ